MWLQLWPITVQSAELHLLKIFATPTGVLRLASHLPVFYLSMLSMNKPVSFKSLGLFLCKMLICTLHNAIDYSWTGQKLT